MLSILVPVYNFDVRGLINNLQKQCVVASVDFEIIAIDDCSTFFEDKKNNQEIALFPNVVYEELPHNIGRSAIRNLLAQKAKYNHLLFLDCDSKIESSNYISTYLKAIKENQNAIIFGGRGYEKLPPKDDEFMLRWKYGTERETISIKKRQQLAYRFFMTNNFIVPKSILLKTPFDEHIIGYGYEDTLFAQDLKKQGIPIVHINNVLLHIGLETANVFLNKTLEGMKNLAYVMRNNRVEEDIKLYRIATKVQSLHLTFLIVGVWSVFKGIIKANLKSKNPNLNMFDFFKLANLLKEIR